MQPSYNRLVNDYNFAGYPTLFMDGGYQVSVGGWNGMEQTLRDKIELCGLRATPGLDLITAVDWLGGGYLQVHVAIGNGVPANTGPTEPSAPSGIIAGIPGVSYEYTSSTTDPETNDLYYQWDWGNGEQSTWIGPILSGGECTASYTWDVNGAYNVMVRVKDVWDEITPWSAPLSVVIGCCEGIRGNIDGIGGEPGIDIADLVYFVDYSFSQPPGPEPPCTDEADVDGTGTIDIA
ncbi:MAG: hypothetical protein ACE5D6_08830, partial [Candidatus Zixiibacteriota bacterium]